MKLLCVQDDVGYWTPGKIYEAQDYGKFPLTHILHVGDDDDPPCENGWAVTMTGHDDASVPAFEVLGFVDTKARVVFQSISD